MLLSEGIKYADDIVLQIAPYCKVIKIAGSIRRQKPNPRDIDLIIIPFEEEDKIKISNWVRSRGYEVVIEGSKKIYFRIAPDVEINIGYTTPESLAAALMHWTGSKETNIRLRSIAKKKGLRLNEYGLFTSDGKNLCNETTTEKDIYALLDVPFEEPKERK